MLKKIITALCILFIISSVFNVTEINNKRRISNHISNYIVSNIQQLSNYYENMYTNEEPNKYFESSLIYAIEICDKVEEEIIFYNTIYPKRVMLLDNLIDDYKLLLRVMKNNPSLIEDAKILHKQLQQYIISYVNEEINYSNNPTKTLYETDKAIKKSGNGDWYLLHDKIIRLSKSI